MEAGSLNAKWIVLPAVGLGVMLCFALAIFQPGYFANWNNLAALLAIELFALCVWRYDEYFLPLLLFAFLSAGTSVPFSGVWQSGRWGVLGAGAFLGFILWLRARRFYLHVFHYFFFAGVCAALASALSSPYPRVALLKVLSLFLLFLYAATGARLSIVARWRTFLPAFLVGCEVAVWISAAVYWFLDRAVFGNQNSLGAIMGVALFPALLWGIFAAPSEWLRRRRMLALAMCGVLLFSSMARAGMLATVVSSVVLLFCLRRYKLLLGGTVLLLLAGLGASFFAPGSLEELKSSVLYKQGSVQAGVLQSRKSLWDRTVTSIQEHPWFGSGFGISADGETWDRVLVSTTEQMNREHGNSYLEMVEWLGLMGVLPFAAVLLLLLRQVWRVCLWMRTTRSALHPAVPLAGIVIAGLVHAIFEDWLLAVGYYLTVLFWPLAFSLMDLLPERTPVIAPAAVAPRVRAVQPTASALVDAEG